MNFLSTTGITINRSISLPQEGLARFLQRERQAYITYISANFKAVEHELCKTMLSAVVAGSMDPATTGSWACGRSFGSYHANRINAALIDDSVLFVTEHCNPNIWCEYATISNGENVRNLNN
jgi:hypothetical protein